MIIDEEETSHRYNSSVPFLPGSTHHMLRAKVLATGPSTVFKCTHAQLRKPIIGIMSTRRVSPAAYTGNIQWFDPTKVKETQSHLGAKQQSVRLLRHPVAIHTDSNRGLTPWIYEAGDLYCWVRDRKTLNIESPQTKEPFEWRDVEPVLFTDMTRAQGVINNLGTELVEHNRVPLHSHAHVGHNPHAQTRVINEGDGWIHDQPHPSGIPELRTRTNIPIKPKYQGIVHMSQPGDTSHVNHDYHSLYAGMRFTQHLNGSRTYVVDHGLG